MDEQQTQEILALAESEKPVVESEQPKSEEQASTPETVEQPEKPSEETKADKTFTQAELDEIVQKRITKLERKMERQRIESETRAKVLSEQQQQQPTSEKPVSDNYATYDDYLEALADFKAEQKIVEIEAKRKQAEIDNQHKSEIERQTERRHALLDDGESKYADFEEVVSASKLQIAEPAYLAILESDISSDLVYHLAKDAAEAERISKLTPYAQAKEIGKLEDRLSAKKPVIKSNAPPPINPVNGSKDFTKSLDDMSVAEYEAEARKRGARWL
jgi:hypothetical protein